MPPSALAGFRPFAPYTSCGWVGVEIFFVISGYVVSYTAEDRSPIAFINSRVLRLLPGTLICALVTLPALASLHVPFSTILSRFVGSILFFPLGPWLSGVYWTLPVEIAFYGVMLALLMLRRFHRIEGVAYALGGLSTLAWLAFVCRPFTGDPGRFVTWLGSNRVPQLLLIHHGVFFALGILLWIAQSRGVSARRIAAIGLFSAAALIEIGATAAGASQYMNYAIPAALPSILWLLAMTMMVAALRYNELVTRALHAWRPVLRALGLATFPLYLLHEQLSFALIARAVENQVSPFVALWSAWAIVTALAFIVAMILEPALRALIHKPLLAIETAFTRATAGAGARS